MSEPSARAAMALESSLVDRLRADQRLGAEARLERVGGYRWISLDLDLDLGLGELRLHVLPEVNQSDGGFALSVQAGVRAALLDELHATLESMIRNEGEPDPGVQWPFLVLRRLRPVPRWRPHADGGIPAEAYDRLVAFVEDQRRAAKSMTVSGLRRAIRGGPFGVGASVPNPGQTLYFLALLHGDVGAARRWAQRAGRSEPPSIVDAKLRFASGPAK